MFNNIQALDIVSCTRSCVILHNTYLAIKVAVNFVFLIPINKHFTYVAIALNSKVFEPR